MDPYLKVSESHNAAKTANSRELMPASVGKQQDQNGLLVSFSMVHVVETFVHHFHPHEMFTAACIGLVDMCGVKDNAKPGETLLLLW